VLDYFELSTLGDGTLMDMAAHNEFYSGGASLWSTRWR
jgi:hypothetical protein